MLGNLKKMLGIEGLKVDVNIPDVVYKESGILKGQIVFSTLRDTQISSINIRIVEKYSRGRKNSLRIDEYVMGKLEIHKHFSVQKTEERLVDFEVPFHFAQSEMDKWQEQNFMFKGIIAVAKKLKGVKSEFFIMVEAKEVGTKLSPHVSKPIIIK